MDSEDATTVVGASVPVGAGLGLTVGLLGGLDVATAAGVGAGGGVLVGAVFARVAPTTDSRQALGSLALFVGLAFGGAVGMVAAWGVERDLLAGLTWGSVAGAVLGLFLAGIALAAERD